MARKSFPGQARKVKPTGFSQFSTGILILLSRPLIFCRVIYMIQGLEIYVAKCQMEYVSVQLHHRAYYVPRGVVCQFDVGQSLVVVHASCHVLPWLPSQHRDTPWIWWISSQLDLFMPRHGITHYMSSYLGSIHYINELEVQLGSNRCMARASTPSSRTTIIKKQGYLRFNITTSTLTTNYSIKK